MTNKRLKKRPSVLTGWMVNGIINISREAGHLLSIAEPRKHDPVWTLLNLQVCFFAKFGKLFL